MNRSLVVLLAAMAVSAPAFGQGAMKTCDPRDPALQRSREVACDAGETVCSAWRRFRATHPFPYQTIALDLNADGEAVVVISEPPPVATPAKIRALAAAVFDGHAAGVHRLRYPVGLDGWLEDIVVDARGLPGPGVQVFSATGARQTIPAPLADRLQFLHEALFGGLDDFYVDVIEQRTQFTPKLLPELKVTGTDIELLISDQKRRWRTLLGPAAVPVAWDAVAAAPLPRAFVDDSGSIVAFTIPPDSDVQALRRDFRAFAIASDFVIGAVQPKRGGVVLLGRSRTISLADLPPLRFETLESLVGSLGQPLGQSYERQRVFAGKVLAGQHAPWDWAPIYLSPQLQDSEFGTLLNLADQELKSWSERGDVIYARFDYPRPTTFPFGELTATGWFLKKALATTLIFNWNTAAFSTAVDLQAGRVISAASTSALPVSYIVPLQSEPEAFTKLREQLAIDSEARALEASETGTSYFAQLGDPILARVARNVFLYQILGETKPVRVRSASTPAQTARSKAITKVLADEATRWLRSVPLEDGPARAKLVSDSGMTVPKLAELLASNEENTTAVVRARSTLELQLASLNDLGPSIYVKAKRLEVLEAERLAEFTRQCSSVGGAIYEEKARVICRYQSQYGRTLFPPVQGYEASSLAAELREMEHQYKQGKAKLEGAITTLQRFATQEKTARKMGELLRAQSSYGVDLDRVLGRVLDATSAAGSQSSIQTPSVVLSCNTSETMAVGGHNIDALPWLVSPGAQGAGAAVRTAGERPTIVVPKDQLGQSTQIARRVVQHKPAATAPVKRTLPEALDLPQEPRLGSFLDELRGTSSLAREAPADVLERARLCECDVYVERGAGNTATVVSLGPPTKVTNVFGSSRLAESLAGGSPSSRVLFAGFEESQASAISQSAVRRHAGASSSRPGLFARSFERAKAMFGRSLDVSHSVLGLRTASGKQALVGLAPGEVASRQGLATLLAERPSWRSATVTGRKTQLVEVVFPPSGGDLGAISVRMLGEDGRALTSDKLARSVDVAIKDAARASARPAVGQVVKRLADQLTRDASVDEVQFFLKGVDTVIRLERDRASGRLVQVASVP